MSATDSRARSARIAPRAFIDVGVLTVLPLIGVAGFATIFQDGSYLLAAVGGLLVGTAVGIAAAVLRLDALLTALLAVAAFYLFGSALALPQLATLGFLPNLVTLQELSVGAVFGWRDIVTLITPVAAPDYIGVLPYIVTLLVGLVSATLCTRWLARGRRSPFRSAPALIAPLAVYLMSVLVGTDEPYFALVRGVAFAVIALVWMSWRSAEGGLNTAANRAVARHRVIGVAVVAVLAIVGGSVLGTVTAPSDDDRFVLREVVDPPFDPLLYPSPLSGFRAYTKLLKDDSLFTVSGLQDGDLIRIATMDSYDGKLWNVTDPAVDADGSGAFHLVARELPAAVQPGDGGELRLDVVIDEYHDVWLPSAGYASQIDVDPKTPLDSLALRYNTETGVLVDTASARPELHYTIDAVRAAAPSDGQLAAVAVANITLPPVENVPDIIGAKAVEFSGDAETPIAKLRAIESTLADTGYLSHGADTVPSPAGHGADRMKLLLERSYMIGDAEQFASAFALMARHLGYPARVVMGFAPATGRSAVTVTGDDVTAWVEVAFDGVGWVPFFPVPDDTEIPQDQVPKPQTEPQPQVRQPPQNTNEQDDLVTAVEIDESDDEDAPFRIPAWVWTAAAAVLIPLAIILVPLLIVTALKRRRRRRRSKAGTPDRRAAGAWDELADVYAELGYRAPRGVTRVQLALDLERQFRDELEVRRRERAAEPRRPRSGGASGVAPAEPSVDETVVRDPGATWRPGVDDASSPLPVLPGLREFAVRTDRATFSGEDVTDDEVAALWSESDSATSAALLSVGWLRRRLRPYRYRTRTDLAVRLAARADAARAGNARSRTDTTFTHPERGVTTA